MESVFDRITTTGPEIWNDTDGKVYLYVPGEGRKEDIKARIPETDVSVFHEIILNPGDQYTRIIGLKPVQTER